MYTESRGHPRLFLFNTENIMSAKKTPAKKTPAKKAPAKAVDTVDKTPATPVTEPTVDEVLADQKPQEPQEQIKSPSAPVEETAISVVASAVAKSVENPDKKVIFVAKNKDDKITIQAGGEAYTPTLDPSKSFLVWKVDKKNADLFAQHSFVRFGKIVRALEK